MKPTYHSQQEVIEMAKGLKEQQGYSDAMIAQELTEDLDYPVTQQAINRAMNGSTSHIKALMVWLEARSMVSFDFERGEDGKPVIYYKLNYR